MASAAFRSTFLDDFGSCWFDTKPIGLVDSGSVAVRIRVNDGDYLLDPELACTRRRGTRRLSRHRLAVWRRRGAGADARKSADRCSCGAVLYSSWPGPMAQVGSATQVGQDLGCSCVRTCALLVVIEKLVTRDAREELANE